MGEGNQLGKTSPAAASFFFKFCFTQPANNQPLRVLHGQLGRAWGTCVACHTPSRTELWEQAATPGSPVALGCQWGLEGSWEECEGEGPQVTCSLKDTFKARRLCPPTSGASRPLAKWECE